MGQRKLQDPRYKTDIYLEIDCFIKIFYEFYNFMYVYYSLYYNINHIPE